MGPDDRLLADPQIKLNELIEDIESWLKKCHTSDIILELKLVKTLLTWKSTPTKILELVCSNKWLAAIMLKRAPNTVLPRKLLEDAVKAVEMKMRDQRLGSMTSKKVGNSASGTIRMFMAKLREIRESATVMDRVIKKAFPHRAPYTYIHTLTLINSPIVNSAQFTYRVSHI